MRHLKLRAGGIFEDQTKIEWCVSVGDLSEEPVHREENKMRKGWMDFFSITIITTVIIAASYLGERVSTSITDIHDFGLIIEEVISLFEKNLIITGSSFSAGLQKSFMLKQGDTPASRDHTKLDWKCKLRFRKNGSATDTTAEQTTPLRPPPTLFTTTANGTP